MEDSEVGSTEIFIMNITIHNIINIMKYILTRSELDIRKMY